MCRSDRVNSGDVPRWTILSQAAKAEGATTIPARGVGSSEPKRPALPRQVMIWSDLHGNVQRSERTVAGVATRSEHGCGDFGEYAIVPNRFSRTRDMLILDTDHLEVDWLRPFRVKPLATTGDATKEMIIGEATLKVKNEAACGILTDLSAVA